MMQLPSAGVAAPRPVVAGSLPVPQSGAAAGFDAVMNGVLASNEKTLDGTAQQALDDGAQEKPATGGPGTVALVAKPEGSKVAKDTVDAPGSLGAPGSPGAVDAGAFAGAAAVAGGLAAAGVAVGTAAPQAIGPGIAAPVKDGVVDGTAPAKAIAGIPETGSLVVGMPAGSTHATPAESGVGDAVPAALPLRSLGQSPTQAGPIPASPLPNSSRPTSPQPSSALPASPRPAGTVPTSPLPSALPGTLPTSKLPVGLEPAVRVTEAQPRDSGTAVVLPTGKPATQQDTQRVLGQDGPAAPAFGLPAGIQAGIPVLAQPESPLQQAPTTAPSGMATPTSLADPAKLLPQVSRPLFSLASAAPGAHVMTLKLSPEDLGPLTVRAHIEGAGVRIELFAPGEAGREAVRCILPELRRGLGESGFGASLDLSEHNAPADAGAGGSDPRDRRPAESPAFPRGRDGEVVRLARTAVVLPRSITSSLDILV
ncbi:flagellar hook-length control protein FliK [Arthrobacter sp. KNU-44]|uniref:flagellar hook-length control protein FliK n=1 Tax=unclassified Arthrobacter TaxID=235627 RepID=UPI003F442D80